MDKIKNIKYYVYFLIIFSLGFGFILDIIIMPIYVRKNEGRYMLNVKNKTLKYAKEALKSEGYKSIVSDTLFSSIYEPLMIVDQYPAPNIKVKKGRTVRLKISFTEKMVVVPYMVGRSQRSAEIDLQQIGLQIDTLYKEYNSEVPIGNITWQYPKSGDKLSKKMGVHLTVSLGVPPNFFQVPNIFGLSKRTAIKELENSGFTLGKIYYRQNEDLIPFTVLDQSISPGTVLEKPVGIDMTISVLDMQDIFNNIIEN